MRLVALGVICAAALGVCACGSGSSNGLNSSGGAGGGAAAAGTGGSGAGGSGGTGTGGSGTGGSGTGGSGATSSRACDADPPASAPQAADPPAYSGTCPDLTVGSGTMVTIQSSGKARQFIFVLPGDYDASQRYPVIFLWHWLGGSAQDFYSTGQVQNAVDQQHFIAIIPQSEGAYVLGNTSLDVKWPFDSSQTPARMNEEFKFFDDMLACVSQAHKVNKNCVASVGVSAGALFTDQLAGARSQYLASFESLSGGTGGIIRPWGNPAHKLPGLVLWGGPTDNCFNLIKFDVQSQQLETSLTQGGDFFVECIHNCGHGVPPFDAQSGLTAFAILWNFVFDHPYWLGAGQSPYNAGGLPAGWPSWCGIGKGSATPRQGACLPPGC